MAKRRMFSLDVCDTDRFLDMPASTQNLYFHLGLRADDDGFVASPRKIVAMTNCSNDDFKLLVTKNYIIPFESGVCVVKDWKINNFVRPDRYKPTLYTAEKQLLETTPPTVGIPDDIPAVSTGKDRLGEVSIEEISLDEVKKQARKRFTPPNADEVAAYCQERGNSVDAERFVDFYTAKGWKVGKSPMKDWKAAVRTWEKEDGNGNNRNKPCSVDREKAQRSDEKWGITYSA